MNQIEDGLKSAVSRAVTAAFDIDFSGDQVVIEIPRDKSHGDYACNTAMQLTRTLHRNPRVIAEELMKHFDLQEAGVRSYEIAGPGFINFTMNRDSLTTVIGKVLQMGKDYGTNDSGAQMKVNV